MCIPVCPTCVRTASMEEKLINQKSEHGELWVDVSSPVAMCSPQKRIAAAPWPCPEMVVLELSFFSPPNSM